MSESEPNKIIEASPVGLVMVDENVSIALVNRVAEKLFGYDRKDLMGERFEKLVPHEAHRQSGA